MPLSTVSTEHNFNLVVNLAKNDQRDELRRLLNTIKSISFMFLMETPIERLAFEGYDDAVKLLIEEFNGYPSDAICGYARAQKHDQVDCLLRSDASIHDAAKGYAMAGDTAAVNDLLQRGAGIISATLGYAIAGNEEAFMPYLLDNKMLSHQHPTISTLLPGIIQGLAFGGHQEIIDRISADKRIVNNVDSSIIAVVPNLLCGYAAADNQNALQNWQQDYPQYRDQFLLSVVRGYAKGGHLHRIQEYLDNIDEHLSLVSSVFVSWLSHCGHELLFNAVLELFSKSFPDVYAEHDYISAAIVAYIRKSDEYRVKELCTTYKIKQSSFLESYLLSDNYKQVEELIRSDPSIDTLLRLQVILNRMNHNQHNEFPSEQHSEKKLPRRIFRKLCLIHDDKLRNIVIRHKIRIPKKQISYCNNGKVISQTMRQHLSFEEASNAKFINSIKRYQLDANQLRIWNTDKEFFTVLFLQIFPVLKSTLHEDKIASLITLFLLPKLICPKQIIHGNIFFQRKVMPLCGVENFSDKIRNLRNTIWAKPKSLNNSTQPDNVLTISHLKS